MSKTHLPFDSTATLAETRTLSSKACANCGTPLDPEALFCHRCGLNLTQEFRATPLGSVAVEHVSDTFRRLRESLGARYGIERELGRGGMATVFLAKDLKHDREVAIKVLHSDLAATIGAERFEREIKLAAKLQHPHILGLYDSGDADGLLYYVMPFVRGESLRDRLDREKMLPVDDAVRIALEVSSALGHAHELGIVHRDIKPENILLAGEHALVADFGIARAATEAGQHKLTQTGMAVGTPVYMAPEQSTGDVVGPTADIYSLGCMLYEMLAGEAPFNGPNAMAIMARHLMEAPPSVRVVRNTVPEEVEQAIFIALNKTPVDRPQTAAQFAELLSGVFGATSTMRVMRGTRSLHTPMPMTGTHMVPAPIVPWYRRSELTWTIFGILIAAGSTVWAFSPMGPIGSRGRSTALADEMRRVAVMHFVDESRDSSLGPVAAGLTDGLIRTLGTSPSLTVISRDGIEPFRNKDAPIDSIARVLRVGFLVRGGVEPEGERVRVSVRLVDASGASLQRGSFTVSRDEVLGSQDSLGTLAANLIREELGKELSVQAQRAATTSQDAWLLTQRGIQEMRRAPSVRAESGDEAMARVYATADSLFAEAAALDARWAEPHIRRGAIALARSRATNRNDQAQIRTLNDLAQAHIAEAMSRDGNNADAYEIRGTTSFWGWVANLDTDPAKREAALASAVADLERATRLNKNQASAYATLSAVYANVSTKNTNDIYIAARSAYAADEFQSTALIVLSRLANAAYDLGNSNTAIQYCDQLLQRFRNDVRAWRCQLNNQSLPAGNSDVERAWMLVDSVVARTAPRDTAHWRRTGSILVAGALVRVSNGRGELADSARRIIRRNTGDATLDQTRELAYYGAFVHTMLGDKSDAMRLLSDYIAANPDRAAILLNDPGWWFRSLAETPEYRQLMGAGR